MRYFKRVACESRTDELRTQLRKVGAAFLTHRAVSAQEAAYRILSLPMKQLSRSVVFVDTNPKNERIAVLKNTQELEQLEDDDVDIFQKSLIDRYQHERCPVMPSDFLCPMDNFLQSCFTRGYTVPTPWSHAWGGERTVHPIGFPHTFPNPMVLSCPVVPWGGEWYPKSYGPIPSHGPMGRRMVPQILWSYPVPWSHGKGNGTPNPMVLSHPVVPWGEEWTVHPIGFPYIHIYLP